MSNKIFKTPKNLIDSSLSEDKLKDLKSHHYQMGI